MYHKRQNSSVNYIHSSVPRIKVVSDYSDANYHRVANHDGEKQQDRVEYPCVPNRVSFDYHYQHQEEKKEVKSKGDHKHDVELNEL